MSVYHVGTEQKAAKNAKEKPLLLAIFASLVLVSTMLFPEQATWADSPWQGVAGAMPSRLGVPTPS